MWTAETVLLCALSMLGRSPASLPPVSFDGSYLIVIDTGAPNVSAFGPKSNAVPGINRSLTGGFAAGATVRFFV